MNILTAGEIPESTLSFLPRTEDITLFFGEKADFAAASRIDARSTSTLKSSRTDFHGKLFICVHIPFDSTQSLGDDCKLKLLVQFQLENFPSFALTRATNYTQRIAFSLFYFSGPINLISNCKR